MYSPVKAASVRLPWSWRARQVDRASFLLDWTCAVWWAISCSAGAHENRGGIRGKI